MERPQDLFDRSQEWDDLVQFAESSASGLRIGVVSGRRRQGKSFLLRRIAGGVGGLYHQAQELGRVQALARFGADVATRLGLPAGALAFPDWDMALRTALGFPDRGPTPPFGGTGAAGPPRLVVLDEFPYLLEHSPELPSVLQDLFDEAGQTPGYPAAAVIVCGSALSVMQQLLAGQKPLRGRAQMDLTIRPFDYRDAAVYWQARNPAVAFALDAVLGGTPGYRSLIDEPVPGHLEDLPGWLGRSVLNPAHALFHETAYLLREDPRMADKQLYNSILAAVATGKHTQVGIGGVVGRDHNQLRHPLATLTSAGFLRREVDMLNPVRPLYFIADPIVRFEGLVTSPCRSLLEERDVAAAWTQSSAAFSSNVLGPHFESLCVQWTARYSGDRWGTAIGEVGPAVVNDPEGKARHQIDVVALRRGQQRGSKGAHIVVLGEAKSSNRPRTSADLDRLERIRALLCGRGIEATAAHLVVFGREGFDAPLKRLARRRDDVHLVDLAELYGGSPRSRAKV